MSAAVCRASARRQPTVWGLDAAQLHARFWASRGVQVVHPGEPTELVPHAELYLLIDARTLVLLRLAPILHRLVWVEAKLIAVRLRDERDEGYREQVLTDGRGGFAGFRRVYRAAGCITGRIGLTTDRDTARLWQRSADARTGWGALRCALPRAQRWAVRATGRIYDRGDDADVAAFVHDLVRDWRRPDATIDRIRPAGSGVWKDPTAEVVSSDALTGPIWIGAGRGVPADAAAVGPAVLWDDPAHRPPPGVIRWLELEPARAASAHRRLAGTTAQRALKRAVDMVVALVGLVLAAPLFPLIALAIVLEDGRPVFFIHRRETIGGREFPCIKFRSMRRDAEQRKAELQAANQADGPQFYIHHDPRLTRVGAYLRRHQLDELPQLINVLLGHMSMVGPRPSPFSENQFCPAWREARLSVRPGMTGLWQLYRTRAEGTDFQEWIRFDLEYVERQSLWLDLTIMARTVVKVLRGMVRP